ncbi:CDGSH iron-sulfur domain-containing protein [Chloroflexota bacterium]
MKQSGNRAPNNMFKIKVSKNGPYLVSGGPPVQEKVIIPDAEGCSYKWLEGKIYPQEGNYALCRCGGSKNKPFCDGTHIKVNFNGTETANREPYLTQAKRIIGPALELTDAKELCSYARFCDRAGGIWSLTENSDNPKAKETAIEEGRNCPSGRLVVWDKEGKAIEPAFEPSIGVVEDNQLGVIGPIWVRGGIPIDSVDGKAYEVSNRVTLCRCGKSANKPFCDGSHAQL